MPKLYSECEKCGGKGSWTPPPEKRSGGSTFYSSRECPDCEGIGAIATSEGAAILDLIKRWRRTGTWR